MVVRYQIGLLFPPPPLALGQGQQLVQTGSVQHTPEASHSPTVGNRGQGNIMADFSYVSPQTLRREQHRDAKDAQCDLSQGKRDVNNMP